jgi:hypothetical protein
MFDTTTPWSSVLTQSSGAFTSSDVGPSGTAKPVYVENSTTIMTQNLDLGSIQIEGREYDEQMCLIQTGAKKSWSTGKLCVEALNMIVADSEQGLDFAQGVIGLAPEIGT